MEFQELSKYLKRGRFFKFCPYALEYSRRGWNFSQKTNKNLQFFLNTATGIVNFILLVIFVFQLYVHSDEPALVALDVALIVMLINGIYVQWMLTRDFEGNTQVFNEYIHLTSRASKPIPPTTYIYYQP